MGYSASYQVRMNHRRTRSEARCHCRSQVCNVTSWDSVKVPTQRCRCRSGSMGLYYSPLSPNNSPTCVFVWLAGLCRCSGEGQWTARCGGAGSGRCDASTHPMPCTAQQGAPNAASPRLLAVLHDGAVVVLPSCMGSWRTPSLQSPARRPSRCSMGPAPHPPTTPRPAGESKEANVQRPVQMS